MSELVLYPQDEAFSFGEMIEDLRERTADFVGRLAARAGFADLEDDAVEVVAEATLEVATSEVAAQSTESRIVYAEEKEKKPEEKPKRPARPPRSPPAQGHDPATCRLVVCSSCNKLGHPK